MSTEDQLLYNALHGTAMRYAAERRNLDEAIEELRQIADGRNDILAEAAGITAGSALCPKRPRYASRMKKSLRCWLTFHDWRLMVNDEGQRYKTCTRCGAYRDFDPRPGM
jgi:hypothetical protein